MAIKLNDPTKPWKKKIGYIKQMWLQPCATDVFAWVLGSFVAAPVFLFAIHEPDCLDYQADRVRAGHKKRRRGSINPADSAKPLAAPTEGLGWVVFKLGSFAQRVGWYMTLIDASLDYVVYMTSFAYRIDGCRDPNAPFAINFFNDTVPFLGFGVGAHAIDVWNVGAHHIMQASQNGIGCPSNFSCNAGFTLSQKPFPTGGSFPSYSAYLVDVETGMRSGEVVSKLQTDGTRTATLFWTAPMDVTVAHEFRVHIFLNEVGIWYGSGVLSGGGDSFEGLSKSFCSKKPLREF
jgi:hypothetical protein